MDDEPPRYCLDTSAWLDWAEEVGHEVRDEDLRNWLAPHAAAVIETAAIREAAQMILRDFNPDLHVRGITGADPFVIAAAQARSLLVITGETSSRGRPKIPDVCDRLNIRHMSLLRMVQREGWRI